MLKTFVIKEENKNSERLVENVKHQIRKYIKRERRKELPEDMNYWHFDCKFARESAELEVIDFKDITKCIDEAAASDDKSFVIEIWAKPAKRERKESEDIEETESEEQ